MVFPMGMGKISSVLAKYKCNWLIKLNGRSLEA